MIRIRARRSAAAGAVLLPLLAGCAGMPGAAAITQAKPLAPEAGDPCAGERAAFAASQDYLNADLVSGTIMGGLSGMASNLGTQIASGSSNISTLGLVQGAVSGARAGYLSAMARRYTDQGQLVQAMNGDLQHESEQTDTLNHSFARLQACRFQQAKIIKTQVRRGLLPADQARTQLAMERRLFDEELDAARKAGTKMQDRDEQFQYAVQQVNTSDTGHAIPSRARRAVAQASEKLPKQQEKFASAVSDADVRSKSALSDDT